MVILWLKSSAMRTTTFRWFFDPFADICCRNVLLSTISVHVDLQSMNLNYDASTYCGTLTFFWCIAFRKSMESATIGNWAYIPLNETKHTSTCWEHSHTHVPHWFDSNSQLQRDSGAATVMSKDRRCACAGLGWHPACPVQLTSVFPSLLLCRQWGKVHSNVRLKKVKRNWLYSRSAVKDRHILPVLQRHLLTSQDDLRAAWKLKNDTSTGKNEKWRWFVKKCHSNRAVGL